MRRWIAARWLPAAMCLCLLAGFMETIAQEKGEETVAETVTPDKQESEPGIIRKHPLTDMPPSGSAVTSVALPEHPQKQFPAGAVIPILLGFHNAAAENYNITAIMGSLNQHNFFDYYIQNFTMQLYHVIVPPGLELTLEYRFRPDPALSPLEFAVAVTVFYENSNGKQYSSTFFNETIDITEADKFFDVEVLFMYATMFIIAGAVAFGAVRWLGNLSVVKKVATTGKPKKTTAGSEKEDDWLAGTPVGKALKKKQNKTGKEGDKKAD